jgi:hypothetical protein
MCLGNIFFFFSFQIFIALFALVAVAAAARPAQYRPAPYQPAPYQPAPAYHEPQYKDTPATYGYEYAVQDDYSGVNFGGNEQRDGYATNGGYRVLLPDGRTQIVTYNVGDAYSGYVADVRYEGVASYAPTPAYKQPAPYKPAPYRPAPYQN